MEQLVHAFGLDAKLIIIQIFNFVVLMGILSYFLYTPILKVLRDRQAKIEQGLKDADAAAEAKADAEKEKHTIVAEAHQSAEAIAARAKAHADEKGEAIVAEAQSKAAAVVKAAEQKGEEIKTQAHKESEAEIAKLAVLAAEKILTEKIS